MLIGKLTLYGVRYLRVHLAQGFADHFSLVSVSHETEVTSIRNDNLANKVPAMHNSDNEHPEVHMFI